MHITRHRTVIPLRSIAAGEIIVKRKPLPISNNAKAAAGFKQDLALHYKDHDEEAIAEFQSAIDIKPEPAQAVYFFPTCFAVFFAAFFFAFF